LARIASTGANKSKKKMTAAAKQAEGTLGRAYLSKVTDVEGDDSDSDYLSENKHFHQIAIAKRDHKIGKSHVKNVTHHGKSSSDGESNDP
jgi:hypothetical protein